MNPEEVPQPTTANPAPEQAAPSPVVPQVSNMKIGKFKASRMIVSESWQVLKLDKEVAWFPVMSAIANLVALVVLALIFFFGLMRGDIHFFDGVDKGSITVVHYATLLVYYIVAFFITNFFLAGMYIVVHGRFNGQALSFSDGIKGANENVGKIFMWSVISATVGVILRIIADKSALIGKIVAAVLGAAWNILTYFSLPALVIGKASITGAFSQSAAIIKKTWGETIIIDFGAGLFFALLMLVGMAVAIGVIVMAPVAQVVIPTLALLFIFIVALGIISSALNSIFKLALYEYAQTGVVPQAFTPALVQGAVRAKK